MSEYLKSFYLKEGGLSFSMKISNPPICSCSTDSDLLETAAESLEHSLHVATLLHGDDSGVIFLINPDQEGLLIVVPEENQLEKINKTSPGKWLTFVI